MLSLPALMCWPVVATMAAMLTSWPPSCIALACACAALIPFARPLRDRPVAQEASRPSLRGAIGEAFRHRGFLLLTDFGSETFLDVIDDANADALYAQASRALVTLQAAGQGALGLHGLGEFPFSIGMDGVSISRAGDLTFVRP